MSRHHAVLHVGETMRLQDLGSENGTLVYLPGKPGEDDTVADTVRQTTHHLRAQSIEVAEGAIISLGTTRLLLRTTAAPALAMTPRRNGDAGWVARSPTMRAVWDLADRAAVTQINVLLLGETGVGKEVMAQRIHRGSPRASRVFLRLNCAAFSESLLESELFGYEKGAFTGAVTTKLGLFESADGGTLLLDEVGELPMQLQGKLLRLIEERAVLRVGALRPRPVDVRIIAATNRDLEAEIAAGRFRQDLYFRLNGLSLLIPPLRERVEEIRPLAEAFAEEMAARERCRLPAFDPETWPLLESYTWPGNVRELRNVIERAIVVATDVRIEPEHLPEAIRRQVAPARFARASEPLSEDVVAAAHEASLEAAASPIADGSDAGLPSDQISELRQRAEALEREQILRALEQCAWNQTKAAELLQISRRALVIRLERHAIPRPRKRSREA